MLAQDKEKDATMSETEFSPAPPPTPLSPMTGRKAALYVLAFVLAVSAVGAIFAYVAPSPAPITEHSAAKARAYRQAIDQAVAQQAALGWTHMLRVKRDLSNKRRVVLRMRNAHGRPLTGGGVLVRFFLPAQDGIDMDVTLKEARPGTYIALTEFPRRGAWEAFVAVRVGRDVYRAREPVVIP